MAKGSLAVPKRILVIWFLVVSAFSFVYRTYLPIAPHGQLEALSTVGLLVTVFSKLAFIIVVFRVSRAFEHPPWLTAIYSIMAPFSVLYLIPFVGLLLASPTRDGKIGQPNGSSGMADSDREACPFCAEDIKRPAVICRYCKSELPAGWSEFECSANCEGNESAVESLERAPVARSEFAGRVEKLRREFDELAGR